jgi:hypothetical protein
LLRRRRDNEQRTQQYIREVSAQIEKLSGSFVPLIENKKCVAKEKSQNGTTSVGSDLSQLPKGATPYSFTSRHSHAVIADRV